MQERELRLALVCYGGISLAVYMHGVTKEIWHIARASRRLHDGAPEEQDVAGVYQSLLREIETKSRVRLRVVTDIVAGASAGGINGIFLTQAIATGQSLEPLTDLWLANADVDVLLDPDARPLSRFTKFWAVPVAWFAMKRRGNTIEQTVEESGRDEVRAKLSNFVRARWLEPPFGGEVFSGLLLDAMDAMAAAPKGPPLTPPGHPVDLIVTVTDFAGHPRLLSLHSPPWVLENEHRLTWHFRAAGDGDGPGDTESLVVAARATASFPGAFPPFSLREMDRVLAERHRTWAGREHFITTCLPDGPRVAAEANADTPIPPEDRVLIDGSVLANAPFRPAMAALRQRPARRAVDRRFIFIDPKPDIRSISFGTGKLVDENGDGHRDPPGFFTTILGALAEIPRAQPIRDNVEAISGMSSRIRRMLHIVEAIRPEVTAEVEALFGRSFFLDSPTQARLAAWRAKAQAKAAERAGFAFASYGHIKLASIVEDITALANRIVGNDGAQSEALRSAIWATVRARGLDQLTTTGKGGDAVVAFFRTHDIGFRIRRLRFMARQLEDAVETARTKPDPDVDRMKRAIFAALGLYLSRAADAQMLDHTAPMPDAADAGALIDWIGANRDLINADAEADRLIAEGLTSLPKADRRTMLLTYLGFPYFDIATLPMLQGEGMDEYDPIKIDRISPSDANAIRRGGAADVLKGVQFNAFGAFFSRAYRENDYLWGRLHGADRMVDILISAVQFDDPWPPDRIDAIKRRTFHAILDEEAPRLRRVKALINDLRRDIGPRG